MVMPIRVAQAASQEAQPVPVAAAVSRSALPISVPLVGRNRPKVGRNNLRNTLQSIELELFPLALVATAARVIALTRYDFVLTKPLVPWPACRTVFALLSLLERALHLRLNPGRHRLNWPPLRPDPAISSNKAHHDYDEYEFASHKRICHPAISLSTAARSKIGFPKCPTLFPTS